MMSEEEPNVVRDTLGHTRLPFAYKLHLALGDMESNGSNDIVSWVGGGRAFKIHNPEAFEKTILPQYFRESKLASFIRQCYVYGFAKIEDHSNVHGAYVHPDFRRDDQARAWTIQRRGGRRDRRSRPQKSVSKKDIRISLDHTNDRMYPNETISSSMLSQVILSSRIAPLERTPMIETPGPSSVDLNSQPKWDDSLPQTSKMALAASSPVSPSHNTSLGDDWILKLEMAFSGTQTPSDANRVLSFAQFMTMLEPRPIESMVLNQQARPLRKNLNH